MAASRRDLQGKIEIMRIDGRSFRRVCLVAAIFVPALSGCTTPDDQVCAAAGTGPGTAGFADCMTQRQADHDEATRKAMHTQMQQAPISHYPTTAGGAGSM
jgi:hypothetical protein